MFEHYTEINVVDVTDNIIMESVMTNGIIISYIIAYMNFYQA